MVFNLTTEATPTGRGDMPSFAVGKLAEPRDSLGLISDDVAFTGGEIDPTTVTATALRASDTSSTAVKAGSLEINGSFEKGQAVISKGRVMVTVNTAGIRETDVVIYSFPDASNDAINLRTENIVEGVSFDIYSTGGGVIADTTINWRIVQ